MVPAIPVTLNLPLLGKTALKMRENGYKLADEFLTEDSVDISNIDLILGAEASHCVPLSSVLIGDNSPSMVYDTLLGILLDGSLSKLCENLSVKTKNKKYRGIKKSDNDSAESVKNVVKKPSAEEAC